jgi:hypothetical protein
MGLRSDGFPEDVKLAHDKSSKHREEVLASALCGCFYCCATFEPKEIVEWVEERRMSPPGGQTALCPRCGIDAVIGDKSGFELTPAFLERMNSFWFAMPSEDETDVDFKATPEERLIPEGYVIAKGWKVGEPDGTKGPSGEPALILVRDDGLRVTIGDEGSSFVAVHLGAIVKKEG